MIGFIGALVTISLNYSQYSAITDLHNLQFTVTHTLGFLVFPSHLLKIDLYTEISTLNHYKVFLPILVQSPRNLGNQLNSVCYYCYCPTELFLQSLCTDHAQKTCPAIATHCCVMSPRTRKCVYQAIA
jgi:hypothetical protein